MATSESERRAVDDDLGLVDALVQLSFLIQSVLHAVSANLGMTTVQMRLLGILRDREPSMGQLARHLGLDKSSVTGLVDRAEQRGFVQRVASADDGRSVRVGLTPSARRLARTVTRDVTRRIDELTEDLSPPQREQLAMLAARVLGRIDA